VVYNKGSLQFSEGAFGNLSRFSSGEPEAESRDKKESIEGGEEEGKYRKRIIRPVMPIYLIGCVFAGSCGCGTLLMWFLTKLQDGRL
jgi:hypothetical protein